MVISDRHLPALHLSNGDVTRYLPRE